MSNLSKCVSSLQVRVENGVLLSNHLAYRSYATTTVDNNRENAVVMSVCLGLFVDVSCLL